MANISVSRMLTQVRRRFKTVNVDDFDADFVDALRQSVGRINTQADLETRITAPVSTEGTVALDETYEYVLVELLIINLWQLGNGIRNDEEGTFIASVRSQIDDHIDDIRQDILNQARDDDDDDEDDLVGLGALG